MKGGCAVSANNISTERVLNKLDEYFGRNDYDGAEKHILFWLDEAKNINDDRTVLLLSNELMGLYRKTNKKEKAIDTVKNVLALVEKMGIDGDVGAGTSFLNCATVYKAFGLIDESLKLFEKTTKIYEKELPPGDKRFGGLYNNMAISLTDSGRFDEAYELYDKAISVMSKIESGELEVAITYLNIANAKEAELGIEDSCEIISELLEKARAILENHEKKDGYYAFVCDKCASVFGYYGYFAYEKELIERAKGIYEGA